MTTRSIAFRVDASIEIGTGHTMRCIALADAWKQRGRKCHFLLRPHRGHWADAIRQRGHAVHLLAPPATEVRLGRSPLLEHAPWLGADMADDAAECTALLQPLQPEWLVVDHYAIDVRWERLQRPVVGRILTIDDLADRDHDADLLLDQNLGRTELQYRLRLPEAAHALVGPRYALLRPEFSLLREVSLARRSAPRLKQMLVTLGGIDKDNATGFILDALADAGLPQDCAITIVMGANAPWLADVQRRAARLAHQTRILVDVTQMSELMAQSDLAIGAAGSTSWERCCLGVPSLIAVLADNQRAAADALCRAGAAWPLELDALLPQQLRSHVERLQADDCKALASMSSAAAGLTDGLGVERVIAHMEQPAAPQSTMV